MSKARKNALRPEVDQSTADYIDAALDVAVKEMSVVHDRFQARIASLESRVDVLEDVTPQPKPTLDESAVTKAVADAVAGSIETVRQESIKNVRDAKSLAQKAYEAARDAEKQANGIRPEVEQVEARLLRYIEKQAGVGKIKALEKKVRDVCDKMSEVGDAEKDDSAWERIEQLNAQISDLSDEFRSLEDESRYSLTKAKMIRLMKNLGYYE